MAVHRCSSNHQPGYLIPPIAAVVHKQMTNNTVPQANRLKKEQEALLSQRWEVERLEEEREKQEQSRRKYELRYRGF